MDPNIYPLQHLEQMALVVRQLSSLPAQLLSHHYSDESFGSWWSVIRHRGIVVRAIFDGKEGELVVERAASTGPPYMWDTPVVRISIDTPKACAALVDAVVRATDAG